MSISQQPTILVLYANNDLRVRDHYPLSLAHEEAVRIGASVIALFVYDIRTFAQPSLVSGFYRSGPLRAKFLNQCVDDLRNNLREESDGRVNLFLRIGFPEEEVLEFVSKMNVVSVYCHQQYSPHELNVQERLKQNLEASAGNSKRKVSFSPVWGLTTIHLDDLPTHPMDWKRESFKGFLEAFMKSKMRSVIPHNNADGRLKNLPPLDPDLVTQFLPSNLRDVTKPQLLSSGLATDQSESDLQQANPSLILFPEEATELPNPFGEIPTLANLGYGEESLHLYLPSDAAEEHTAAIGGETAALRQLESQLEQPNTWGAIVPLHLADSDENDNNVRQNLLRRYGFRLSPHISHGTISARQALTSMKESIYPLMGRRVSEDQFQEIQMRYAKRDFWHFLSLRWGRTMYFPYGPHPEDTEQIADYRRDAKIIQKWCDGRTGIPLVDAGMKELNTTGVAHDYVRQAVGWTLTRGLGQDWRVGAEYFERTCLDYDPHVCYGNFLHQAGLVQDRFGKNVFDVHFLAAKHDTEGTYVRRWLPQLSKVPQAYIHRPHVMTSRMQEMHSCRIGRNYPLPIKLWEGASAQYPTPQSFYSSEQGSLARNPSLDSIPGIGEAHRFGTNTLPAALQPFSRVSGVPDYVLATAKRTTKKLVVKRAFLPPK